MYTAGGAFLGKLANAGLARRNRRDPLDTSYSITAAGRELLRGVADD
jgi:hypothetical protein